MEIKTLEEALARIKELEENNKKIIQEKKDIMKRAFDKEELEGMSDNEKKIAQLLEEEREKSAKLSKEINDFRTATEAEKRQLLQSKIDKEISRIAGNNKDFEAKLRTNVDLLEKLPRLTDEDISNLVTSAYNLTGQKEVDPMHQTYGSSNNPTIKTDEGFIATERGKAIAQKMGINIENKQ